MAEVELVGYISKLEEGFAFAQTDEGNVFIPIAAARLNKGTLNSLKEKFSYRDEVVITAVPQKAAKNGCKYYAKKVRAKHAVPSPELSTEVYGPVLARVTSTEQAFAFAQSEEFGTIFVPGGAFDADVVKNVRGYIDIGSQLVVNVQEQKDFNGCKWKAVKAVRHFETTTDESEYIPVTTSCGKVMGVAETEVLLYDETNQVTVRCSQLTYVGGLRGKRNVHSLLDVITEEEPIMYKAEMTSVDEWNAVEWKQVAEVSTSLNLKKSAGTSDSTVQTSPCILTQMVHAFLRKYPDELTNFEPFLKHLPAAALPDSYQLQLATEQLENMNGNN